MCRAEYIKSGGTEVLCHHSASHIFLIPYDKGRSFSFIAASNFKQRGFDSCLLELSESIFSGVSSGPRDR